MTKTMKKFSIACSPSNPYYKYIRIKLENEKSLEMVKACLPSMRQSTATLINCYPESLDITVQGHQSCVELAQRNIDLILQDFKSNSSQTQSPYQYDGNSNHSPSTLIEAKNSSDVDVQYHHDLLSERPSSQTTNSIIPSPVKSDVSVFLNGDHSDQCDDLYTFSALSNSLNNECVIPAHTDTVTSSCPPFQDYTRSWNGNIDSDSSNDSEQDNILEDDRFSKHIDQARKLGFSEEQTSKVLRRLGVDASIDDMMREFVSDPQGLNQEDDMERLDELDNDDNNLSSKGEDSDDSEGFDVNDSSNLRHIIIDGSNVAMSHGQKVFSCLGIKIVVDWFKSRGHKNITAFVPQWRKEASRPDAPITNQEILSELEAERIVVFTPSRRIGGARIVCYDDRYILQLAVKTNGIVVSNDVFRDLERERDDFKEVVEKRLLMYSFVQDTFMPPEDPLGRQGPSLDNFLRIKPSEPKNKPQICPFGKKCTFGIKCRFYHPERRYSSQKMVAEKLKESAELKLKLSKAEKSAETATEKGRKPKQKLSRTVSLVPQDADNGATYEVIPGQTKKPQLHHSKSLVYPSSYLTDLRLKMEKAEVAETVWQSSFATIPWEVNPDQTHTSVASNDKVQNPTKKQYSNSCNPSPRTSPTPTAESVKPSVKAVHSFPSSPVPKFPPSCPVNGVSSSLNIPNPESQNRYLSGHLLVVKKLSDEDNSNGTFFSKHTSRAPGSSQQGNQTLAFDVPLSSDSNPSLVSPMVPVSTSKQLVNEMQESNVWNGQEIYMPPEGTTQVVYNELVRRQSNPISPTNSFFPKERQHIPASTQSLVTPISEHYDSCPTFSEKDKVYDLPEKHHFKRSLSSSTSPSVEYFMPPRHSPQNYNLNTISTPVKPNSNVPFNQRNGYNQYSIRSPPFQPPPFQRSRASFDSGISSGGLSVEPSLNSPFSPTENTSSPFSYTTNMPNPAVYSPTTNNPARFMMTQQETMYNSSPTSLSSPSALYPFSPMSNRILPPPFQDQCRNQMHVPTSNLPHQTQHPPICHPPHFSTMAHHMSCPPPSQPQVQSPYQPQTLTRSESRFYPMSLHGIPDNSLSYNPNMNTPLSPFLQQPPSIQPQSKMIDEEAAISVEDPRYSMYYNLSSVFGERAVRTFMNRNPDVRNFSELYSLIASYKQDTGI